MDFQVKDQTYFLSLSEDERKWRLFVFTPAGGCRIPVYEDGGEIESFSYWKKTS